MRVLFVLCLFFSLIFGNDFSQKKIIKIEQNSDKFELIDLNQDFKTQNLDEQKGIFNSSTLIEKNTLLKDNETDFAIVLSFRKNFAYFLDGFNVNSKDFSYAFSKNLIQNLKLNFINAQANGIYQNQKTLNSFSPKDSTLVNVKAFLKKEKDKSKIYAKFIDYVVVVNLQDFYINITNYFFTTTKEAVASVNFKIISTTNGKIKSAKNAKLSLALKELNFKQGYDFVLEQMPQMLAKAIEQEAKKLK